MQRSSNVVDFKTGKYLSELESTARELEKDLVSRPAAVAQVRSTPKSSKTFEKWLKRAQDAETPWTETEIVYFRKAVGSSSALTQEQRYFLLKCLGGCNKITPEQTEKGIEYLLKTAFKKNGEKRRTKNYPFQNGELKILKDFSHFTFEGVENASENSYKFYLPIYRVHSSSGEWFEYLAGSLGSIEVLRD